MMRRFAEVIATASGCGLVWSVAVAAYGAPRGYQGPDAVPASEPRGPTTGGEALSLYPNGPTPDPSVVSPGSPSAPSVPSPAGSPAFPAPAQPLAHGVRAHGPPGRRRLRPRTWEVGASVDVAYQFNSNRPNNHIYRGMVPTPRTGEFALNLVTAHVEHEPTQTEPWKLQVLLHAGSGVDALTEFEPVAGGPDGRYAGREVFKHIGLANAGVRARTGTTIEAGVMPAPLGIEWFWPHRNDHQTVSWTANGTPFYLMGAHVRQELPKGVQVFGYVVNGWQTMSDLNSVPSYVAGLQYQPRSDLTAAAMVYFGPDDVDVSPEAWRVNTDASLVYETGKLRLAAVWDVGRERLTAVPGRPVALWTGGGLFARGTVLRRKTVRLDLAARPEAWWDRDGRIYGVAMWLLSGTATASVHFYDRVLLRAEYRYDHSTARDGFFYRLHATADDASGLARHQHIVGLSLAGTLRHRFGGRANAGR